MPKIITMKKLIYFTSVICLLAAGCKKDLDVANPNNVNKQNFWKNAADAHSLRRMAPAYTECFSDMRTNSVLNGAHSEVGHF